MAAKRDVELEDLQAKVGTSFRVIRVYGYETNWHGGRFGEKPRYRVVRSFGTNKAAAMRRMRSNTLTPYLTKTVRGVDHDVISRLEIEPLENWYS